jgi:hypothetical protein
MTEEFFSLIEGLTSENLTSEVLAFVLRERMYAPVQRLFFSYLLNDGTSRSTSERDFSIATRLRYQGYGEPDILISGTDSMILIENKFYAPYSGIDQLSRYFRLLKVHPDFKEIPKKALVLLTPSGRVDLYLAEIIRDFAAVNKRVVDLPSLRSMLDREGITFRILEWQEILRLFESADFVLSSLSAFIKDSFIKEVKLMENEMQLLQSEAFPAALQKVLDGVMLARERVHALGTDTKSSRFTQSIDVYGFYAKSRISGAWFGYYRQLWTKYKPLTPLYLQFRPEWVQDQAYVEARHKPILMERFLFDETFQFIKPYPVRTLNDIDSLATELINDVRFIEAIISREEP